MDTEKGVSARARLPINGTTQAYHSMTTGYTMGWENKDEKYDACAWAFKAWAEFKEGKAKIYGGFQML